ncbi:MAG: hypothetical protein N3D82_02750 [Ignisphaera sp.]|nr:hypothetical protein [Ignisphaera sp.]MCX8167938.1 hypothetical protein [Ignisphaera sp.]MDW8086253.1 hypothetical protein [Ignisphaera sp.]
MASAPPIMEKSLNLIRDTIRRHISTKAPGLLEVLNLYSLTIYGKEVLTLFVESPCAAYRLLYQLYRDEAVASIIITTLFVAPLSNVETPHVQRSLISRLNECMDRGSLR